MTRLAFRAMLIACALLAASPAIAGISFTIVPTTLPGGLRSVRGGADGSVGGLGRSDEACCVRHVSVDPAGAIPAAGQLAVTSEGFHFNWRTPSMTGCFSLMALLSDGSVHAVSMQLR